MLSEHDLLDKWEPKVHSLLRNVSIRGWDYDDLVQFLRLEVLRAAKVFDVSRGVSFHTLVHKFMKMKIAWLMQKAKHKKFDYEYLQAAEKLEDETFDEIWDDTIQKLRLTPGELIILDLILCGYQRKEIKEMCVDSKSFGEVYRKLKEKIGGLKN